MLENERTVDLMAGDGQVALRVRADVRVLDQRQLDAGEAAGVTALAQKWHRKAPAKLPTFLCDPLVRATEHVLGVHAPPVDVRAFLAPIRGEPSITLARAVLRAENRPVSERSKRLGANEALFREVNERVADVVENFVEIEATISPVNFNCECGHGDCTDQIEMTLIEYEAVRADPTRFAVRRGHEVREIERIVEEHPNYLIVEKQDPEAEEVALETDPRS